MARTPTKQQQKAIDAREGNYIVSASAGSGKTFVLTNRVYDVITSGTKLSELLVLTFTNLAAAEMRDRIRKRLNESGNSEYKKIAASLDAANIQTYDAFALNLVKKYHDRLNLPQDVKLVDEVLLTISKNKILTAILENAFDNKDEAVLKLVDNYCYKSFDELKEFILNFSDKLDLLEDKASYLEDYVSLYMNEKTIRGYIDEFVSDFKNKAEQFYHRLKTFECVGYIEENLPFIESLTEVNSFKEIRVILIDQGGNVSAKKKTSSLKDYPSDKSYHDYISAYLKSVKESYLRFESEEEIIDQYLGNKDNIETIIEITKTLDQELTAYKHRYNVFCFADIFKYAMQLADIPDIRKELKNKYKYIMIDEYQDTSDLQEKFIQKIANNNVYVVGDVKQSIYRFRNANCQIFLDKFIEYGKGNGGSRIELPENFRSRHEVVDAVNKIFSAVMSKDNSELDYPNEHAMAAGNKSYLDSKESYEEEMICYSKDDLENSDLSAKEYEIRLIATDIARKKAGHFQVYDHDLGELRDCEYSDFAILESIKSDFSLFQDIFNEYQIPLYANYNRTIIENKVTIALENIFRLIVMMKNNDCAGKFKHCYISIMRSFLLNASDEEVDHVGSTNRYEDYLLFDKLKIIEEKVRDKSLKDHILIITEQFDIYNRSITIGNVSDTISLLEYYFNIASQMDEMGYDLEDFVTYFDDLKKYEIEPEFSSNDQVDNSVKLMTIHASKGLQFKICYYPNLTHTFNFKSLQSSLLYDAKYGFAIPNVYSKAVDPFVKSLIVRKEKKEAIKEQIRLFYVALTRAEEKIIFVTNPEKRAKQIADFFSSTSFLDFITFENVNIPKRTFEPKLIKGEIKEKQVEGKVAVLNTPKMDGEQKVISHASKSLDDDVDNKLLLLGEKYHYYLEITDFSSKDVSFIKDEKDRRLLSRFLSNEIFRDSKNAKVLHEYSFFDETNNVSGVIDLLLIYDDHIDIVDFKLSHVDDEAYEKQLGKYKAYISQLSSLPIHTYVTGIMSGDVKQVE